MDGIYDMYIPDHRGTGYSNLLNVQQMISKDVLIVNTTYGDDIHHANMQHH